MFDIIQFDVILGFIYLPSANEIWGKVMFLHGYIILFTGEGLYPGGLPPGRVCLQGESASEGAVSASYQNPPARKRAVRILLECFLVAAKLPLVSLKKNSFAEIIP